jgi:hypothetical protein
MSEPRPFWHWTGLALAPGLGCDLLAMLASASRELQGLSFLLLFAPILILVYLVALANAWAKARNTLRPTGRLGFVLGFGLANLFLWGASCAIVLSDMSFH